LKSASADSTVGSHRPLSATPSITGTSLGSANKYQAAVLFPV
jgi:hypothetical protein